MKNEDEPKALCDYCQKEYPLSELIEGPDPYTEEICGKLEVVTICKDCYRESCMDI